MPRNRHFFKSSKTFFQNFKILENEKVFGDLKNIFLKIQKSFREKSKTYKISLYVFKN